MPNPLDETAPVTESRSEMFHGTLADIKATPKEDPSKPDPRLEDLNRQTFF